MSATVLSVGIDDTDSPLGMCTTYLGFKIVGKLRKKGVKFSSYPRLVRFNPNIPWKTRGNGAVGLTFLTNDAKEDIEYITHMVEKNADVKNGANPAAVFCTGTIPESVRRLGKTSKTPHRFWNCSRTEYSSRICSVFYVRIFFHHVRNVLYVFFGIISKKCQTYGTVAARLPRNVWVKTY